MAIKIDEQVGRAMAELVGAGESVHRVSKSFKVCDDTVRAYCRKHGVPLPGGGRYHRKPPTVIDGHRFASKTEAERYKQLVMTRDPQGITHLVLQPEFVLCGCSERTSNCVTYRADFLYREYGGKRVAEDTHFCMRDQRFEVIKKLWRHFGPCELRVLTGNPKKWKVEVIEPQKDDQ